MSDQWTLTPIPVDWKFDTETMSYKGHCQVRGADYNILWCDLYKYCLVSHDFSTFKANCVDAGLFMVNVWGDLNMNIGYDNIDTICFHAWHQYKALTGA